MYTFFSKKFFSKNVIVACFSTHWIRIWHRFFDLRLLNQDMSTFTTKMSTFLNFYFFRINVFFCFWGRWTRIYNLFCSTTHILGTFCQDSPRKCKLKKIFFEKAIKICNNFKPINSLNKWKLTRNFSDYVPKRCLFMDAFHQYSANCAHIFFPILFLFLFFFPSMKRDFFKFHWFFVLHQLANW